MPVVKIDNFADKSYSAYACSRNRYSLGALMKSVI